MTSAHVAEQAQYEQHDADIVQPGAYRTGIRVRAERLDEQQADGGEGERDRDGKQDRDQQCADGQAEPVRSRSDRLRQRCQTTEQALAHDQENEHHRSQHDRSNGPTRP